MTIRLESRESRDRKSWCRGMAEYLQVEFFRKVWDRELASQSYYGLTVALILDDAGFPRRTPRTGE